MVSVKNFFAYHNKRGGSVEILILVKLITHYFAQIGIWRNVKLYL